MKIKIREYSKFEYIIKCENYNDRKYLEKLLINNDIPAFKRDCSTILINRGLVGRVIMTFIDSCTQFEIEV